MGPQGRRRVAGSRRKEDRSDDTGPAAAVQDTGEPDLVVVGRIGRPQGIKGEVTVEVRTDDPDERFAPGATLITEQGLLTVAQSRDHSGRLVVLFEGVADRNGAELLRDRLLHVDARSLPALEGEDDFYDSQLLGLSAELTDGTAVGEVSDVLHLPHGDVLVLAHEGREHLVPFVRAIVPTVDLTGRRLVVEPPPGLLDLSEHRGGDADEGSAEPSPESPAEGSSGEPGETPAERRA
jgi:16S rRNA processing protein RimM